MAGAHQTRQALIDAATRSFAEHGIQNASLLEITRQAGQRNRGAVHYHFGSREGMLVAVLEQAAQTIGHREGDLLARADEIGDDLCGLIDLVLQPAIRLASTDWRGRCQVAIVAELAEADPTSLDLPVFNALRMTGHAEVYVLLQRWLSDHLAEADLLERLALIPSFVLRAIARHAALAETLDPSDPLADTERFSRNLKAMIHAMVSAPALVP